MPGIGQRKIEGHRFSNTLSFAVISRFILCDKIHRQIVLEVLEEKIPIRVRRSNPRGVKRKGSSYNVVRSLGKTWIDEYIYTVMIH